MAAVLFSSFLKSHVIAQTTTRMTIVDMTICEILICLKNMGSIYLNFTLRDKLPDVLYNSIFSISGVITSVLDDWERYPDSK